MAAAPFNSCGLDFETNVHLKSTAGCCINIECEAEYRADAAHLIRRLRGYSPEGIRIISLKARSTLVPLCPPINDRG
jgi:hypothetical protein